MVIFSLRELTCMHCVYLALWTRKILCGSFLCAIKFIQLNYEYVCQSEHTCKWPARARTLTYRHTYARAYAHTETHMHGARVHTPYLRSPHSSPSIHPRPIIQTHRLPIYIYIYPTTSTHPLHLLYHTWPPFPSTYHHTLPTYTPIRSTLAPPSSSTYELLSNTVLVTSFRTADETAISEVYKLLRSGGVPTSLTSLLWRWLTVSSVFTARSARTNYSCLSPPPSPLSPSLISLMVSVDLKHHVYLLTYPDHPFTLPTLFPTIPSTEATLCGWRNFR